MNRDVATTSLPQDRTAGGAPLIRIVSDDRATLDLLCEWLEADGYRVGSDERSRTTSDRAALALVDVPFTRHGAAELLGQVAARNPGVPILALSATFFSNVKCGGDCARTLGVAGVLPKPVTRAALLAAVRGLLRIKPRNGS